VKVLHIVPALFGNEPDTVMGGAERYAFELARHMAASVSTSLLAFGSVSRDETIGKLRVRVLPRSFYVRGQRTNPLHFGMLGEILKADIVHCHQQHILTSSLAAAICRCTGKRVFVSDLGGGGWDISAYVSTDCWYRGHLHISEYSRRIAGHQDWHRAHVIWGGVDTEKFSPDSSAVRSNTVIYVGRILPHKGINYLIEALPAGLKLRVIGNAYDERFAAELRRIAASKDVRFETNCDDDGLINAYRTALCVVLPSVYRDLYGNETKIPELLGQTLLEGMACESPAICTDVASLPEIVEDTISGFIVPPNNPGLLRERIQWFASHRAEAAVMGARARDRVREHFSWPAVVARCLEIYEN
jgi:alpha-maltose-1-phosphate synthase